MNIKPGDRIELIHMGPDPRPIEIGEKGTVLHVSVLNRDEIQVGVQWDNGRRLHLIVPPDEFKVIKKEDL